MDTTTDDLTDDSAALPARLAGAPLELIRPTSIAERWDVCLLAAQPGLGHRSRAAALGLCWPRFRRRHPYRGDALAYSTVVLDELLGGDPPLTTLGELVAPGLHALRLCLDGLAPVDGADGFYDRPSGGATDGRGSS